MGVHVDGRSQMIRRFPSRFRGVAIWAILFAGWSIPTAGQQNVLSSVTPPISGKISFEGTPPPNDKNQKSSHPYFQMHAEEYIQLSKRRRSATAVWRTSLFM